MKYQYLLIFLLINLIVVLNQDFNIGDHIRSLQQQKQKSPIKPILLVPGLTGSNLEAKLNKKTSPSIKCLKKSDWYNIWISFSQMTLQWSCFKENIMLSYNKINKTYSSAEGVQIRPVGFGDTKGVEHIHPMLAGGYAKFVEYFVDKYGYVRNSSISAAPFDFRISPRTNKEWMEQTKALIEELYEKNNKMKVVVISQSMGSPVFLYFLNQQTQQWKNKYIDAWFSGGGVFGGTVYIGGNLIMGEDMGFSKTLDKLQFRDIFRTWESFYWLQTSQRLWNSSEVIYQVGNKTYTASDYEQFFSDNGIEDGYQKYKKAQEINKDLTAPGVTYFHAYSLGIPTPERMNFKNKDDINPEFIIGDGDGTVNKRSLEVVLKWKFEQTQPVYEVKYDKIDHAGIVGHPSFLELVDKYMNPQQ